PLAQQVAGGVEQRRLDVRAAHVDGERDRPGRPALGGGRRHGGWNHRTAGSSRDSVSEHLSAIDSRKESSPYVDSPWNEYVISARGSSRRSIRRQRRSGGQGGEEDGRSESQCRVHETGDA